MKKLIAVLMALSLLLVSFAAVAEKTDGPDEGEKVVNWSDYEAKTADIPGVIGTLGGTAMKMFVPNTFKDTEVTQEMRDVGMFLLLKAEDDENATVNAVNYPTDIVSFLKYAVEHGSDQPAKIYLNGVHAAEFNVKMGDDITFSVAFPTQQNTTVVISFTPANNEKYRELYTIMASSLQIAK